MHYVCDLQLKKTSLGHQQKHDVKEIVDSYILIGQMHFFHSYFYRYQISYVTLVMMPESLRTLAHAIYRDFFFSKK